MIQHRVVTSLMTGALLLTASGFCVNVTVNSTQPEVPGSNYQTIGAALTYVKAQPAPHIVRITGGGPYFEASGIQIDYSLTMSGDGYKPVIVCGPTNTPNVSASNLNNGIYIFVPDTAPADTHIDVDFRNFIVIPDKTNPPINHGIRSNTDAAGLSPTATVNIAIQDVVVTANDGSDNPVTMDGFTPTTAPAGIVRFGNRGLYFSGHINDLATTRVISSWNIVDGAAYVSDSYAGRTLFNPVYVGPGCVFSYNGRNGVYFNSDGTPDMMMGTANEPIWIHNNRIEGVWANWQGALGIWHDDDNRPECTAVLNYVYVVNNNQIAFFTGYVDAGESLPPVYADHCFFTGNNGTGLYFSNELTVSYFMRDWLLTNCTFANNGLIPEASPRDMTGPLTVLAGALGGAATGTLTFQDCILAGKGSAAAPGDNTLNIQDPLGVIVAYSGLVLAGPQLLSDAGFTLGSGVPTPVQIAVVNADPQFASMTDMKNPNYYGVQNAAYGGKGSGGTNLSGAGKYLGGSSVGEWSLF